MKLPLFILTALATITLLFGCKRQEQVVHNYPRLDESPPPPMPKIKQLPPPEPIMEQKGVVVKGWLERQIDHETTIKSLREYAADPNHGDHFKLSPEEINELEKNSDISFN